MQCLELILKKVFKAMKMIHQIGDQTTNRVSHGNASQLPLVSATAASPKLQPDRRVMAIRANTPRLAINKRRCMTDAF